MAAEHRIAPPAPSATAAFAAPVSAASAAAATATAAGIASPAPATGGSSAAGIRMLQVAETQVGQQEEPPGSNDGPAIAVYRSAVAGAVAGDPWCADFVSWAARQAGAR